MLKRLTAIILILVFAFNIAGYYIVFKIKQQRIKKEVKQRIKDALPDEELVILHFNISSPGYTEIDWIEDHEFIYKGSLYDVVRRSVENDSTITLYCINDEQEKKLFTELARYMKEKKDRGKNEEEDNLLKLFTTCLSEQETAFYQPPSPVTHGGITFPLAKTTVSIPTPPPDTM